MSSRLTIITVTVLLLGIIAGASAQEKPRIIKVIGTGKAEGMPILTSWFTTEPSTEPIIIPTRAYGEVGAGDIQRFMRIYFPRTYENLLQYEFFFMAQVDMQFIGPKQEKWIFNALSQHPKGGVNTRSIMSTHDWLHLPWRDSIISDAFPNDVSAIIADTGNKQGEPGTLIIKDDPALPNIMKSFKDPIEGVFGQYAGLNTIPKPGSVILSYTRNNQGIGHPVPGQIAHVFYWRWNESITFTFQDMVYDRFWSPRQSTGQTNPYAPDIIANIVWFSTGRELPNDPFKVHDFRRDLYDFQIKKSLLVSLLEFAESFGANPDREYDNLGEVEDMRSTASDYYLEGDFDAAYNEMELALEQMVELEEQASQLKNKALFWVYVVEWTVTTGVFLVAGFVLWTLMVRRALYHEVGETRTF